MSTTAGRDVVGPHVDELVVGQLFDAPGLTLTEATPLCTRPSPVTGCVFLSTGS